jgi:hypothetical protein
MTDKFSMSERLANIPTAVRPIVAAARHSVRSVAPEADEIACQGLRPRSPSMMWKLVRYIVNNEAVITIGTFTKHASIFFARGSDLDDGGGLLEGTGKNLRYITLRTPADAKRSAVKSVLRKAFALAKSTAHEVRPFARRRPEPRRP